MDGAHWRPLQLCQQVRPPVEHRLGVRAVHLRQHLADHRRAPAPDLGISLGISQRISKKPTATAPKRRGVALPSPLAAFLRRAEDQDRVPGRDRLVAQHHLAVGETVILLHPPLPLVGISIGMERGHQQNDSLVRGYCRRVR